MSRSGSALRCRMDGFLHIGLQFKIELHTEIAAALLLDAFRLFAVSTIDLRVVLNLARLHQSGIKFSVPAAAPMSGVLHPGLPW